MPLNLFSGCGFDFKKVFFDKLTEKQQIQYNRFVREFDEELRNMRMRYRSYSLGPGMIKIYNPRCHGLSGLSFAIEEDPDEETKLRFLRSDHYDVAKAKVRLLKTIRWREDRQVAGILKNRPPYYDRYLAQKIRRIVGYDREQRPIIAERFGETLARNNLDVMSLEEWLECIIYETELLIMEFRGLSKKHGRPIGESVTILDLKGATLYGAYKNLSYFKTLDKELKNHYPELAGPIVIVNASYIATSFYNNIVKKFIAEETAAKVEMFTGVPTERLLRLADPDQLPVEYGKLRFADWTHLFTERFYILRRKQRQSQPVSTQRRLEKVSAVNTTIKSAKAILCVLHARMVAY